MSRFYITKIAASGDSVKYSTIEFKDGINLIVGPSNTGKSYIISCIDFMMAGKEPPFSTADTGYNKVSMTMESNDGHTIIMTRAIEEGESGDKASNVIEVDTDIPDVRSGEYKISDGRYQKLLLKLLGIDEPVKIISTQAPKTEELSFRTMWHLFFLDEEHMIEHCGNNQIIIAENELPADVDYSSVNMLTFTQEENDGERYGFLHSVRN